MSKNIVTPGDQFAKKGTTPWADWQRSRLKIALKDVNFEARTIVGIIRDMCTGVKPAWLIMTREECLGFLTFEDFVKSPEGVAYGDYPKFRAMALSEPGNMSEREFDLLTVTPPPDPKESGEKKGSACQSYPLATRTMGRLRAIKRADPFIRGLYIAGLIEPDLATRMGTTDPDKKIKAQRALAAIRSLPKNGDDKAYRKAVNDAVRREFSAPKTSVLEVAKKTYLKLSKRERTKFIDWIGEQNKGEL